MNLYLQTPVTTLELRKLAELASQEKEDFFARNPHLISFYKDRFVAAALCQGAALQFVGCGYGVKDFDIHFFYLQNPKKQKLSRTVKRITVDVGHFTNMPVDFVRTLVPDVLGTQFKSVEVLLRRFLETKPTNNAWHLSKKAVVGLLPESLFGEIIWNQRKVS